MTFFSSNLHRPIVTWYMHRNSFQFRGLRSTSTVLFKSCNGIRGYGSTQMNSALLPPQTANQRYHIDTVPHYGKFSYRYLSTNDFTPMSQQEEEDEKVRVSQLSSMERDLELRQLNRQIAVLEKKRGINTGELYTWSGRYKALARDYGMPLVVWYWAVWISTGIVCYGAIILFDVDVIYLLQQLDARTGWDLTNQINPEYGKIGIALVANEVLEPVRLPIVIVTVKPVMDKVYPPKY